MAETTTSQFDFLTEYVLEILEQNNIQLTEEQKDLYIPRLLTQVEQRLGLELVPKLTEEQLVSFNSLLEKEHTTSLEWETFWKQALPTLEEDVKGILNIFADEVRQILAA